MNKTIIKDMKNLSLVAIMMAAIIFAACSGEENIISTQPATGTFTLTVNASKGDDADTRALSLDGTGTKLSATWTAGDAVTVYNVTKSAALTGTLTAQSNGKSTTLSGTLTGTIAAGDNLKLKFLSPNYSLQDGTLAGIASSCDYAEATVAVSSISGSSVTTSNAAFTNQQAIVEFTLRDNTDAVLNAKKLTVNAGSTTINVTPTSATDVLYVAIPGIISQNVSLSAIADGTTYTYEKTSVTLTNNKFYGYTVSMAENPLAQALTFEAIEAGAIVTFTAGTAVTTPIEYSTDGITWTTYSSAIVLSKVGDKVLFRGDNEAYGASPGPCSHFRCSKFCYVYGNIMSLVKSTDFALATELTAPYTFAYLLDEPYIKSHSTKKLILPATTLTKRCYYAMFVGCGMSVAPELPATTLAESCYARMFNDSHLHIAPELPATTLVKSCYDSMFDGCSGLTTVPDLPATTLVERSYSRMFNNCSGLIVAPNLAATTLTEGCYEWMFSGCTSLTTAPELPATTLAEYCYQNMFCDCTSLTTAPALPATTLTTSCYYGMFNGCSSLTTAPELLATTLAQNCYESMFEGCTSLTTAPELPATTLAYSCYDGMFFGCTSLITAPELPATTLTPLCYQFMFSNCTSLTTAPDLPATTLVANCYQGMFQGCTSLNKVKCLATSIFSTNSTSSWLDGVSSTGTFTKAAGVDWSGKTGSSGIPSGWMVNEE